MSDLVDIGQLPSVGDVPDRMHAQVVRQDRFGDPRTAFQPEVVDVPPLGPDDVLIGVMAAGINFNNVWAARGQPIDVIAIRQKSGEPYDFHIGGSDASGVVYAIGSEVSGVSVGDEVVVHPGFWNADDPAIARGVDPMIAPSAAIWGYNTNFGSFGQFCVAQSHQVMPKAPHLTWEEAAAPTLVGATAYRMLHGWQGNTIKEGDVVLVWGGSGGLGTQAIQLTVAAGGRAVAVVSSDERGEYCKQLGAEGYINRKDFDHWGVPPHWTDDAGQREWTGGCRAFGKAVWEQLGERRNPGHRLRTSGRGHRPHQHLSCVRPGEWWSSVPGTTGYTAVADLRYHWVRQKRLQGSHGTNDEQAYAYNQLVIDGKIDPCLGDVFSFADIGEAHYQMEAGVGGFGNRVALVGAAEPGLGRH